MSIHTLSSLYLIIYYNTDWSEYDDRTDFIIRGDQFDFDIDKLNISSEIVNKFVAKWVDDINVTSDQFSGKGEYIFILCLIKIVVNISKANLRRQN